MGQLYTSGDWLVKEGKEEDFVAAWRELADWTGREIAGAGWARLLQDRDEPRRFLSFGPWETLEAIAAWRGSDGFRERFGRLRDLLEDVRPRILEVATEHQAS